MSYPSDLQLRITAALDARGPGYQPRTRHLENGEPVYTNRLIFEDSPYLLQHAHNPVEWFPWGAEAFAKAARENKPIFLSIGYATCHWCHVMEEDSFESVDVANVLNAHFVAVKVDREQYPDVDQAYMAAVNLFTGQGGWPMSLFLTEQGKPFFCGTYYPRASFIDLLLKIKQGWDTQRPAIIEQARRLVDAVQQLTLGQRHNSALRPDIIESAVTDVLGLYDSTWGGFSDPPKFPCEPVLLMLLQVLERRPIPTISAVLEHTLSTMARGGIYDQVAGGFHRYAVDREWQIPHFEKMLYNQAYLARVYARAFRLTGNPCFARVGRQTLDYVLREMKNEIGLFYSATDADSEGREGRFFVWDEAELRQVLGQEEGAWACELFGVTPNGNFEGKNILHLPLSLEEVAEQQNLTLQALFARIDRLLVKLRAFRNQRIAPLTDKKIIVAWNGMLITALAEAGDLLAEPRYVNAAEIAIEHLWNAQRPCSGRLWRVLLEGQSSISARQEDYAHFIEALLALYDIDGRRSRLAQARALADEMLEKFTDVSCGALFMGEDDLLFVRPQEAYDGALPSGNAVAVRVLGRLARRTGKAVYREKAESIMQAFSGGIRKQPAAYAYLLAQLEEIQNGETGLRRYVAQGGVKITAKPAKIDHTIRLTLDLDLTEGRYITVPSSGFMKSPAFEISLDESEGWELCSFSYPDPVPMDIGSGPERGYSGLVQIECRLAPTFEPAGFPIALSLRLQVCDHQACLGVETVRFSLYAADCR